MDNAVWAACALLGSLVVVLIYLLHKGFRPRCEQVLRELPPQEAQKLFRHKMYYRCAALACFLAAVMILWFGESRIVCLVFVGMGFMCQYGVYRLRCRFPAAAPPAG